MKQLQEQLISNPDLTTVNLKVTTFDGIETLTIQFANAEKRSMWESAFLEAKNSLSKRLKLRIQIVLIILFKKMQCKSNKFLQD